MREYDLRGRNHARTQDGRGLVNGAKGEKKIWGGPSTSDCNGTAERETLGSSGAIMHTENDGKERVEDSVKQRIERKAVGLARPRGGKSGKDLPTGLLQYYNHKRLVSVLRRNRLVELRPP